MELDNGLGLTVEKEKRPLGCRHCNHSCHCSNGSQCPSCGCINCEHNALDEFHNNLK